MIYAGADKKPVMVVAILLQLIALPTQGAVFYRQGLSRLALRLIMNVSVIVTSFALLLMLYAFELSTLFAFGATFVALAQLAALWKMSTRETGKFKELSSFHPSTIFAVALTNIVANFIGWIQAIVDVALTETSYGLWVGPLSNLFVTMLGMMSTAALVYAYINQMHAMLKFARHLVMVMLIVSISSGLLYSAYLLAILSQAALLIVSKNIDHKPHAGGVTLTFGGSLQRDRPNAIAVLLCLLAVMLYLVPVQPDYVDIASGDGPVAAVVNNSTSGDSSASFALHHAVLSISVVQYGWIFTYTAAMTLMLAIGQQRRDMLMISRGFITVAAGIMPWFTIFMISRGEDILSKGAMGVKAISCVLMWITSWAMIVTSRTELVPQSDQGPADADDDHRQGRSLSRGLIDDEEGAHGDETQPYEDQPSGAFVAPVYPSAEEPPVAASAPPELHSSSSIMQESSEPAYTPTEQQQPDNAPAADGNLI